MKKSVIVFILLVLISLLTFQVINAKELRKDIVEQKLIEKLSSGEEKVKVLIIPSDKPETKNSFLGFFSEKKNLNELLESLGPEAKLLDVSSYGGYYAELSLEEIQTIQDSGLVKNIRAERELNLFLEDSIEITNASSTWNLISDNFNLTGIGQTICVIDSGVNYNHTDFGNCYGNNNVSSECKILGGRDFCADDGSSSCNSQDDDPLDVHGHGTHVAGIISANGSLKGIAPDAKVIMIKASNSTGSFSEANLIKGIDWCVSNASQFNITTISMSLGGGEYTSYCDSFWGVDPLINIINDAISANISVVVASGNDGNNRAVSFPACLQNVTRVGSTDKSPEIISSFSNYWSLEMLFAPGKLINSTWTSPIYKEDSGTSMAAPHVSAAIAILNQYLNSTDRKKTPLEIEAILNASGRKIYDSENGMNYSVIDIYSSILYLEEYAPVVKLISPENGTTWGNTTQTFRCNATDIGLKNISFYLWNSSGEITNETSFEISGDNYTLEIEVSNLSYDLYNWNCFSYDLADNLGSSVQNYTIRVGNLTLRQNSPQDNYYTNQDSLTFNCSTNSYNETFLSNLSFFFQNSTGIIYNETVEITGEQNESLFYINFSSSNFSEGNYSWNCVSFNNESFSVEGANQTVVYDTISPNVTSIQSSVGTSSISIVWNTSEVTNYSIDLGSYSSSEFSLTHLQIISGLSASTNYNYNISFCDIAGNCNSSLNSARTSDAPASSSSGGGGGGGTTSQIYSPKETELSEGFSKPLTKNDQVKLIIQKQNHTLIVQDIKNGKANLSIRSEPLEVIIAIGEEKRLNLTSVDYFDLYLKAESITNGKINLTIRTINEPIFNNSDKGRELVILDEVEEPKGKLQQDKIYLWIILLAVLIFIGLRKVLKKK